MGSRNVQWSVVGEVTAVNVGLRLREDERGREGRREGKREGRREGGRQAGREAGREGEKEQREKRRRIYGGRKGEQ